MTIKWVKVDPLVMNGEPFCYGSRLTVRQLLELRSNGYGLTELLKDHPELRVVGIAAAYTFAANHPERYAEFLEADGSLAGPGYSEAEAARPARAVPPAGDRDQASRAGDDLTISESGARVSRRSVLPSRHDRSADDHRRRRPARLRR